MTRGRKQNLIPAIPWHIEIPIDLAFQVEARLLDPVTKKAGYGSRSKLIQSLLHEWVRSTAIPTVKASPPAEETASTQPAPQVDK